MKQIALLILLFSVIGFAQEFHSTTLNTTGRIYAKQDSILTTTIDWNNGNCKIKLLTANVTLNMINTVNGAQITIVVSSIGNYTVSWSCSEAPILWSNGIAPVQTPGKTDIYSFIRAGGKIYGSFIQNF